MKAVLFDLDGTLTNTLDDIADSMNHALQLNGLPSHPVDAYRYMVGNGARKLAERAVGERKDLLDAVYNAYMEHYKDHAADKTCAYEGTTQLLKALIQRGILICVLSNKPHRDTITVVNHYFPDIRFNAVQGQVEGVPVKPDPAGALALARKLNIDPSDFAYLGDTGVDMTCAVKAGMHPFGALWGFRDADELKKTGAEILLKSPPELLAYI
ncbi:MAG: HAD family hydrolase [Spirochaetales bacterium]|nr:HAD family hydrolase [Spirochaetales bacterium]